MIGMTKHKATITVDEDKAQRACDLAGTTNFSHAVDLALQVFILQEQGRRDAETYEHMPLTVDETGPPRPAAGDPSDNTDWEEIYRDVLNEAG
jgi:Arc/MetJ family transcription regulator